MSYRTPVANLTYQTTDGTQQTVFSIAVAKNSGLVVTVELFSAQDDYSNVLYGTYTSAFYRTNSGSVTRVFGGSQGLIKNTLSLFPVGVTVDLVANTGTNAIDVKITGLLLTTINHRLVITTKNI